MVRLRKKNEKTITLTFIYAHCRCEMKLRTPWYLKMRLRAVKHLRETVFFVWKKRSGFFLSKSAFASHGSTLFNVIAIRLCVLLLWIRCCVFLFLFRWFRSFVCMCLFTLIFVHKIQVLWRPLWVISHSTLNVHAH